MKLTFKRIVMALGTLSVLLVAQSCSTTSVETVPEAVLRERKIQREVTQRFEEQIILKRDLEISVYLRSLAGRLQSLEGQFADLGLGVFIIQNRDLRWRNYALPGNRLYISAGLLRTLSRESEIYAALAIQFGHLKKRHVVRRFAERQSDPDRISLAQQGQTFPTLEGLLPPPIEEHPFSEEFFGPNSIFSFTETDEKEAMTEAVGFLYSTRYDPRAIVSLLTIFEKNPNRSPYDPSELKKLLVHTRSEIAKFPPLLNPVINSEEYKHLETRFRQL
ncbi:hypothetical protein WDW86_11050 [Bdellovibrionota bacterium FG-2]